VSLHRPANWLVTYDITCPRRLTHVFKTLKKHGVPVQYSVFHLQVSAAKIGGLMVQLSHLIDSRVDDVRAYRIPESAWKVTLGHAILPDDILLDSSPEQP